MLRSILLILVSVIGLAILRNLVRGIGHLVARTMAGSGKKKAEGQGNPEVRSSGTLVRDPQTGTYVDPAHAVRARVGGTLHYFESESSRDAYVKANA